MRRFFGLPVTKGSRDLTKEELSLIVANKNNLYKEIVDLSFHGRGGFQFDVVYGMPTWVRKYSIQKLNQIIKEEGKLQEKQMQRIKSYKKRSGK